MEQSIIDFLTHQIGQNGIFFALFLYMFYTSKKESKDREEQLVEELHKSQDLLATFADKYDLLNGKIDKLTEAIREGAKLQ